MSERIYDKEIKKSCPRCGCNKIKVAVWHFGSTHKPMCADCGLAPEKGYDHENIVEQVITNTYFEWEYKHQKPVVIPSLPIGCKCGKTMKYDYELLRYKCECGIVME